MGRNDIIDFEWCNAHGMEKLEVNVASDTTWALVKDRNYAVVYTETTMGMKKLQASNGNKRVSVEVPRYDFDKGIRNEFTVGMLGSMCGLIGLEWPFEEIVEEENHE